MIEEEEEAAKLRDLVCILARQLWSATITGSQVPKHRRLYEFMRNPRPGDLVIEITRGSWERAHTKDREGGDMQPYAIGRLLRTVREPVMSEAEWLAGGDTLPVATETVYYLETLAGHEFRWHNAQIIRLPESMEELSEWIKKGAGQP